MLQKNTQKNIFYAPFRLYIITVGFQTPDRVAVDKSLQGSLGRQKEEMLGRLQSELVT